jgi:hypothetical protein
MPFNSSCILSKRLTPSGDLSLCNSIKIPESSAIDFDAVLNASLSLETAWYF